MRFGAMSSRAASPLQVPAFGLGDGELIARYDRLFESCPRAFIQQSTYWAKVIQELGPDEPIFLLCRDGGEDVAGVPLYVYRHALGNVMTSVPQQGGLGGIFCRDGLPARQKSEAYRQLLQAAIAAAQRHDCLSLSLITNPFDPDIDLYEQHFRPDYWFENFTQYIPLDRPVHRTHGCEWSLKKAQRVASSTGFCQDLDTLRSWYAIHEKRHTEIGARPYAYRLFANIFEQLVLMNKAQLILTRYGDDIASGCYYIYHKDVLNVLMISMDSQYARTMSNFVTTDYSIQWARQKGITTYNWESSVARDNVYKFKAQWGSVEKIYYYVTRLFCDPARILQIGVDNLRKHYYGHYVVPYGVYDAGFDQKHFKKA